MRHNQSMFFIIGISCFVYVGTFWAMWVGNMDMTTVIFGVVALILLVLSYMFLHGAFYVKKSGTKVKADIIASEKFSDEDFLIHFGKRKTENQLNGACIAKYSIDNKVQYEFVGLSKIFNCVPDKKADIYVIKHKVGIKTDYQVVTQKDYVMNYILGVLYCVMLVGWIFLFVMRGL